MRRTSLITIFVFVAGLCIGYLARSVYPGLLQRRAHAADLAAIEGLHQDDIQATLTQDPKGLIDIWSEDAVRFGSEGLPTVGKQAIQVENEKARAQYPGFKVLSYTAKYNNIQIENDLACEWGEHDAHLKLSADAPPTSFQLKGLHVLRRQSDGSWKFVVIMFEQ
jgi:ketosteroid isomerase-like protein